MNFGIAGLGNHAINRVMPVFREAGHSISAVYSRNIDKARKEGMKYNARPFDDLDSFFENGEFEAVYIASPNFLHYGQTKMALQKGKHVLLEKQMTLKTEEADELVKLAEEKHLTLAIGFHMRFHPAIREIQRILKAGELGEVSYITGMWASLSARSYKNPDNKWWREDEKVGGGAVMGTGVHVMDTINYILGKHPDRLSSFRNPSGKVIEHTEHVTLQYGPTIVDIIASREMKSPMNNLTLYGTEGTLVATGVFSTSVESALLRDGKKIRDFRGINVYREEIKAFADLVQGRESHIATGKDGAEVVRIVNLAFEADRDCNAFRL